MNALAQHDTTTQEDNMNNYIGTATYSPEDDKLRLYPLARLCAEDYQRVKAAGFGWAPKQECFYAVWGPGREDVLTELCGEIEDEDKSLVDRAEQRAERFDEYSTKRAREASREAEAVKHLADGIPLGQPILVGHHSERRARKDAERIDNGMRKAVKLWETSEYWKDRAAGALAHAKYKEIPAVRHRRIKGLESELRKLEKSHAESETARAKWAEVQTAEEGRYLAGRSYAMNFGALKQEPPRSGYWDAYDVLAPDGERWRDCPSLTIEEVKAKAERAYTASNPHRLRWIAHIENRIAYERAMLDEGGGLVADQYEIEVGGTVVTKWGAGRVLRVNKSNGRINSVSVTGVGWPMGIETIKSYTPPNDEERRKTAEALKLPPMLNYRSEGCIEMTEAEWKRTHNDYKGSRVIEAEDGTRHRRRFALRAGIRGPVFLTDAKVKTPESIKGKERVAIPAVEEEPPKQYASDRAASKGAPIDETPEDIRAMAQTLKGGGVQVVSAPQLFPTPEDLAREVVEVAEIANDHRVFEPSAGTGNLVAAIAAACDAAVYCVEVSPRVQEALERRIIAGGFRASSECRDFLEMDPETVTPFDRVVMNPPFENGSDIRHILHARRFLKPGGKVVAICANGPRQNAQLRPIASYWRDLPPGSFKSSGTDVNTAMLVLDAEWE